MLWKIYFWIVLIISIITTGYQITNKSLDTISSINLAITILQFTAFAGYVFKRRYLGKIFWKVFFPVMLIWDFIIYTDYLSASMKEFTTIIFLLSYTIVMIPYIPMYIAIYKYIFVDSKLTDTQLEFKRQMKNVKKRESIYDTTRKGNPFHNDK